MKRKTPIQHTPQWDHMREGLPALIFRLGQTDGSEIQSREMDAYFAPYSESDVCTACRIDAAFEVQERLRDYNKRFANRDSSPYLSRIADANKSRCSCKH